MGNLFLLARLWQSGNWFLYHDNATHARVQQHRQMVSHEPSIVIYPPYSPDLIPYDFPVFENGEKSKREEGDQNSFAMGRCQRFQRCLKQSFDKCIVSNGRYFQDHFVKKIITFLQYHFWLPLRMYRITQSVQIRNGSLIFFTVSYIFRSTLTNIE